MANPVQPTSSKSREARRVAAHAAFEVMVSLGINRTWALEIVWRMFAR